MKFSVMFAVLFTSSFVAAKPNSTWAGADDANAGSGFDVSNGAAADSAVADGGTRKDPTKARRGDRVVASADAGVRTGPVGAALMTTLYVRHTFDVEPNGGYEKSYIQGGVGLMLTPASLEPQAHV